MCSSGNGYRVPWTDGGVSDCDYRVVMVRVKVRVRVEPVASLKDSSSRPEG